MTVKFTNNASTTVATGINSSATSLTVASASAFPQLAGADDYCYLTIQQSTGTVREVVKATALSSNTFTIVRAQDNTSAGTWSVGDIVELRMTAALLTDVIDAATVEGVKTNFQYTPTAGQTVFSGADNSSNTMIINQAALVSVYMNGVRLVQGTDYNVSSANNTVTLTVGATTADIIDIEVFGNFTGQSGAAVAITGGAISGTSVAATTLSASGTATLNTFVSNNVTISGGTIESTNIGATTAGTGRFSTLAATGNATFSGTISSGAITSTGSSTFTSTGVMDINLVANPPELNFEDTSSSSGTKRARWTLDNNSFIAQGVADNDGSVTQSLLNFSLSSGAATFGGSVVIANDSDPTLLIRTATADQANSGKISFREASSGTTGVDVRYNGNTNTFIIDTSDVSNALTIARTTGNATFSGSVTASGDVSVPNLNVADDIRHTGDTDTYISLEANAQTYYSGGTRLMDLKVGDVIFNEGGGSVDFRVEAAGSSHALFVKGSTGNVGIGTSNVDELLHIEKSAGTTLVKAEVAANSVVGFEIKKTNATTSNWRIVDGQTVNGKLEIYDVTNSRGVMTFDQSGNVGIGGVPDSDSGLHLKGDGKRVLIDSNDFNLFSIGRRGSSGAGLDVAYFRMKSAGTTTAVIDAAGDSYFNGGNVGIGTSSPQKNLEIKHATLPVLRLNCGRNETSGSDYALGDIEFFSSDASGTGARVLTSINAIADAGSAAPGGHLTFKTAPTNSAAVERLRIDSTGIIYVNGDGTGGRISGDGSGGLNLQDGNGRQTFKIMSPSSGSSQAMTLDGSGNLLVGRTATATAKLHLENATDVHMDMNSVGDNRGKIGSKVNDLYIGHSSSAANIIFKKNIGSDHHPADSGDETMRIDNSGSLLVGHSSFSFAGSSDCVQVSGTEGRINIENDTTSTANVLAFYNPNGNVGRINTAGASTNYITSSDQRLKDNIEDAGDAGEVIDAIQVRQFDWKADGKHQRYGMVAQELNTVAPEAVYTPEDPDEMMGVDYSKLVPMLIKEIQSLRSRVAELENN